MITVTERAAKRIKELIAERNDPDLALRVGVKGGGCSGFFYFVDLTREQKPGDQVFELSGVKLLCDPKSYLYLTGSELDFGEGLLDGGFRFNNPNAKKSCACGESFSV
jgi:iron-sulfur cluster assembly protein